MTIGHWKDECVLVNYSRRSNDSKYLSISLDIHNVHIYGGPINTKWADINWPSENRLEMLFESPEPYMYIQTDFSGEYYQAVLEPYWLFSTGYYIYVDNKVPLFAKTSEKRLDLEAKTNVNPYYQESRRSIALNFAICKLDDPRQAHEHAIKQFLAIPSKLPDTSVVNQPIWSTRVPHEYEVVNETAVMDFAERIIKNGYGGQLVIAHKWEKDYGSLEPDTSQFPDFKRFIDKLKSLNFTLSLLVHPFVSNHVKNHLTENERGYLIKGIYIKGFRNEIDDSGEYINSTNSDAWNWLQKRLLHLRNTFGINSFNFDNGDYGCTSLLYETLDLLAIIQANTKLLASLDSNMVTNVARGTQEYGFFLSMAITSSNSGIQLGGFIPRLLRMNILGYSFVLPRIIGSDLRDSDDELFIREVQLCVFMPSMQFSIHRPPWFYGEKVGTSFLI